MSLSAVAMDSMTAVASATLNMSSPIPSSILGDPPDPIPVHRQHHANAVVAFLIGLGIVTLASIMNAAGLNLTKLDHVSRGLSNWFELADLLLTGLLSG